MLKALRDRDLEIQQLKAQLALKLNGEWQQQEAEAQMLSLQTLLQQSEASRAQLQDRLAHTQADTQS